jgi:hypothetical protein
MRKACDLQQPVETLFKQIKDCADFSDAVGVTIGHAQQINVGNVMGLHIWLHTRICLLDSIIDLFAQCFNGFLEADKGYHLVAVVRKLRMIDEGIM